MSQAHDAQQAHEGPIKTPKQLVLSVVAAFAIPILIIVLLIVYVSSGSKGGAGTDAMSPQAVAERIQPIGSVEIQAGNAGGAPRTGEQVYQAVCAGCHGAGTLGAPKFGDAAAWGPRIATGFEALVNSALKGKNAMPAKGGASDLSDYEVERAIVYMTNDAGGKFAEPAAPAEAASAAQ
jgi:cytochrome c5